MDQFKKSLQDMKERYSQKLQDKVLPDKQTLQVVKMLLEDSDLPVEILNVNKLLENESNNTENNKQLILNWDTSDFFDVLLSDILENELERYSAVFDCDTEYILDSEDYPQQELNILIEKGLDINENTTLDDVLEFFDYNIKSMDIVPTFKIKVIEIVERGIVYKMDDPFSSFYDFEKGEFAKQVFEILKDEDYSNTWIIKGRNMGWRNLSGYSIFTCYDGDLPDTLIKKLSINGDYTLKIYKNQGDKDTPMTAVLYHHDSPTGEYYSITNVSKHYLSTLLEGYTLEDLVLVLQDIEIDEDVYEDSLINVYKKFKSVQEYESYLMEFSQAQDDEELQSSINVGLLPEVMVNLLSREEVIEFIVNRVDYELSYEELYLIIVDIIDEI